MATVEKLCCVCGKDVANSKRVKDARGRYYCEACAKSRQPAADKAQAPVPAAVAAEAAGAFGEMDLAPVPEPVKPKPVQAEAAAKARSCPSCHAALGPGAVFCVSCGFNLRLGKQTGTAVKKTSSGAAWLSFIPLEVYLTLGGIALFAAICLASPLFPNSAYKVCGFSLILIPLIILSVGSRKCRRILVDEYGWSETLFRIPILRNFVFLGGLFSVPKLWLITLRYGAAAVVFAIAGVLMLPVLLHLPELDSPKGGQPSQVSHTANFVTPPVFSKGDSGIEVARLTCEGPDHVAQQLWIFRPKGSHPEHSMPCLFIAPGNIRMIYGSSLVEDDSEEYESYAQEGFIVVAYSLDGEETDTTEAESFNNAVRAIKAFKASHGGIANARTAIDYVLHNLPEADPQRLYAGGSNSGGAVALNVAAAEPRISAVYALGPITDALGGRSDGDADLTKLETPIPDIRAFVGEVSPVNHVREMHCPIFIYQPGFDLLKTRLSVEAYCKALTDAGANVTYRLGPSDLESIKKEDLLPEIVWLKALKGKPAATTSAPATEPATAAATAPAQ